MGIKYFREYEDINKDLKAAIKKIEGFYEFLGMNSDDWSEIDEKEKEECLKTLSDDIFFGLGADPEISIGEGSIVYDESENKIEVLNRGKVVDVVSLK